jgi:phage tail sheath protein FI
MPVYTTPGVYVEEINALPPQVVAVPTAVPAFIGCTALASKGELALTGVPVTVASLVEYESMFGAAPADSRAFFLYDSLRLFFANGGGRCYIVSAASFDAVSAAGGLAAMASSALVDAALAALEQCADVTIVVIPDLVLLTAAGWAEGCNAMLRHCAAMQNRFAILDIYEGYRARSDGADVIAAFRASLAVAGEQLSYGAAYYPWLNTNIDASGPLPPSGAIAGLYAYTDNTRGVFTAPANVAVICAVSPAAGIDDHAQADLNAPLDGLAVNAIRSFPGKGVLVWGARTLDGNSADWRYISVRRTVLMLEQSIKLALQAFTFAANDAATWVAVQGMVENFLNTMWREGALQGAKPSDACYAAIGLGRTMTENDILEGRMVLQVGVALVRPAEFLILTFQQQVSGTV